MHHVGSPTRSVVSIGFIKISEHELYRCPEVVKGVASSLQKFHDIYRLDIMLVEVSYWQRIDEILR